MSNQVGRQSDIEQWVIETSRDLKLPVSNLDDDFFDAGGTSLSLMRLIARVESYFGVVLDPDDILDASTIRGIAATIYGKEDSAQEERVPERQ